MNFQNPQSRTLMIMLVLGGFLVLIIFIIALLPKNPDPGPLTPTPIIPATPYPTPQIIDKTEDGMLILRKNPDGKYIVESLDPNITDEEIKEKLNIDDGLEYEVVIPALVIPNQDDAVKEEDSYEEIVRREYGLNPDHSE